MPDRLRILSVIASSDRGGAERGVATLLQGLDRSRFEVLVACHGDGPLYPEYARAALEVARFDLVDVSRASTVGALAAWMRALRCDVVHTHLWSADLLGGAAALRAGVRARLATVWGRYFLSVDDPPLRWARRQLLSRSYRVVYRMFDRVVAVSQAVARDLREAPGLRVPERKLLTVHPGVRLDVVEREARGGSAASGDFGIPPGAKLVTTVANFFPIKGHRFLLAAWPRVLRRCPRAVLALVGDGPGRSVMAAAARRLGVHDSVLFLGSRADVPGILARSDVVVVPSVSEGLGLAIVEAMALGRPVVATCVGGIPELIEDASAGLLVPAGDPEALAEAVLRVLEDDVLAGALGRRGPEIARRFSADAMVRRMEALYLALARPGGESR